MVEPVFDRCERLPSMCESCFPEYPLSATGAMFIFVFVLRGSLTATPSAIRMTMRVGAIEAAEMNSGENGYCRDRFRAKRGMYINPKTEYSAADSARTAAMPMYGPLPWKPNRRSFLSCHKSIPAMSIVETTFNDTDIDQNAVPKSDMSVTPKTAPGFAVSTRSAMEVPTAPINMMQGTMMIHRFPPHTTYVR